MSKEWDLSSKIHREPWWEAPAIEIDDVKEFIRRLKDKLPFYTSVLLHDQITLEIDKLAGEELTNE